MTVQHNKLNSMLCNFIKTKIREAAKDNFREKHKRKLMSMLENSPTWADSTKDGILNE